VAAAVVAVAVAVAVAAVPRNTKRVGVVEAAVVAHARVGKVRKEHHSPSTLAAAVATPRRNLIRAQGSRTSKVGQTKTLKRVLQKCVDVGADAGEAGAEGAATDAVGVVGGAGAGAGAVAGVGAVRECIRGRRHLLRTNTAARRRKRWRR